MKISLYNFLKTHNQEFSLEQCLGEVVGWILSEPFDSVLLRGDSYLNYWLMLAILKIENGLTFIKTDLKKEILDTIKDHNEQENRND